MKQGLSDTKGAGTEREEVTGVGGPCGRDEQPNQTSRQLKEVTVSVVGQLLSLSWLISAGRCALSWTR